MTPVAGVHGECGHLVEPGSVPLVIEEAEPVIGVSILALTGSGETHVIQ